MTKTLKNSAVPSYSIEFELRSLVVDGCAARGLVSSAFWGISTKPHPIPMYDDERLSAPLERTELSPCPFEDEFLLRIPQPVSGQVEYRDDLLPGLRLRIFSTGARSFILRRRFGECVRNIKLGTFQRGVFGVDDAREKARSLIKSHQQRRACEPPRGRTQAEDFTTLARLYLVAKADLRSIREVRRIFDKEVLPYFGNRLPEDLSRSEITRRLECIRSQSFSRAVAAQPSPF